MKKSGVDDFCLGYLLFHILKADMLGKVMTVRESRRTWIVAFVAACFKISAPLLLLDLVLDLGLPTCFCILFITTSKENFS